MDKPKGITTILREYFGLLPGTKLHDFAQELKALTDDEKLELARGAAANMGMTQEQLSFPLS